MSDLPTIHELMGRVMADVGAVAKNDRNTQQGFSFRGIDSVVNAVGPVLRRHGVVMMPIAEAPTVDHYTTSKGTQMAHVLLPVTFHFWGPAGDSMECRVVGEASDAGDKVLSKAHAVAWRIALLECFAIPTDDPDPDTQSHERAAPSFDWRAIGWADQAEHDAARAQNGERSRSLPDDLQAELKGWLEDQGWKLPYERGQMDAWADRIDALMGDQASGGGAAPSGEDGDPAAGLPFTEEG